MAKQGEIRGSGPRCACGGLLLRVWDKATGRLEHYQCMGCDQRYNVMANKMADKVKLEGEGK